MSKQHFDIKLSILTQDTTIKLKLKQQLSGFQYASAIVIMSNLEDFLFNNNYPVYIIDIRYFPKKIGSVLDFFQEYHSDKQLVLLIGENDFDLMLRLIKNGYRHFLNIDNTKREFQYQIETLLFDRDKNAMLPANFDSLIINLLSQKLEAMPEESGPSLINVTLKSRELKVLNALGQGKTYEEAALEVGMKIDAFRYNIKKIYRKLNANNKVQALKAFNSLVSLRDLE